MSIHAKFQPSSFKTLGVTDAHTDITCYRAQSLLKFLNYLKTGKLWLFDLLENFLETLFNRFIDFSKQ